MTNAAAQRITGWNRDRRKVGKAVAAMAHAGATEVMIEPLGRDIAH
jgi:hypothetical protein